MKKLLYISVFLMFLASCTGDKEVRAVPMVVENALLSQGGEVIYNLQGQRIIGLQKGLNIVDGKKIMVR